MLFENRFYTTKEMYTEYVRYVLCRRIYRLGIPLTVLAFLGCALSLQHTPVIAAIDVYKRQPLYFKADDGMPGKRG